MPSIPTLTDGVVTLRGPREDDVEGSVEQCRDPLTQLWTTVPVPYTPDDAKTYLRHVIPGGWATQQEWGFVIEAADDSGTRRFAGSMSLRNQDHGRAEVAYGAHPWARGRGLMERALRLLLDWGFAERDLQTVSWLAQRGNWGSRRLAWRLGFSCDGTLRHWLTVRGELGDAWVGTLRRGEPMLPRTPWLDSPTIVGPGTGTGVRLRRLREDDRERLAEAYDISGADVPGAGAPDPGDPDPVLLRLERAADGEAVHWAVADPATDVLLGEVALSGVRHRREAALGYVTHPEARRRGVATEAARLAVRHAFIDPEDGGLGLRRLTAEAAVGNDASHRVLAAAGFVRTGTERAATLLPDGRWVDVARYDLLRDDLRER